MLFPATVFLAHTLKEHPMIVIADTTPVTAEDLLDSQREEDLTAALCVTRHGHQNVDSTPAEGPFPAQHECRDCGTDLTPKGL